MGSDVLSLKWNGHKNTFFDVLATARKKKTFCDATIACEGNLYPVHRFVISTCSTYFERILENISATHPVIVLTDIKSKDIEDLLQYIYTGEVEVLQDDIESLIKAGEVLKIKGIGVPDENEKLKKQKRFISDSEERPEKHQRTDEFGNRSIENESSRESKSKNKTKHLPEGCNEDTNKKEIDDSLGPSNHLISEFIAVKEEIFQPSEDSLHFLEHHMKEELSKSLIDEEYMLSAGCDKVGTAATPTPPTNGTSRFISKTKERPEVLVPIIQQDDVEVISQEPEAYIESKAEESVIDMAPETLFSEYKPEPEFYLDNMAADTFNILKEMETRKECPVCNAAIKQLAKHLKNRHPDISEEERKEYLYLTRRPRQSQREHKGCPVQPCLSRKRVVRLDKHLIDFHHWDRSEDRYKSLIRSYKSKKNKQNST